MYLSLAYYPGIAHRDFHVFRNKYEPFSSLLPEHLTFDHWLFWTIREGNELVIRLHDDLYTGILAPHLREDLPYMPHIGLGLFSKEGYDFNDPTAELTLDREKYERARKEFEDMNLDLWFTIDQLTLLRVNAEFTECREIKTFQL